MASEAELLAAAQEIVVRWSDDVATVEPLLMSENAVYRVATTDGGQFVLRLHRPGYNTPEEMRSEVTWMHALLDAGVAIARPRPTLDGTFHVPVAVTPNETREVGAVEWIDGRPLSGLLARDPDLLDEALAATGALTAQLREQATGWEPPAGFVRRRWDADGLIGDTPLWGRFWDTAVVSDDDRPTAIAARDRLREELRALPLDTESFGLIHADLHVNNVMRTDDGYVAIDFDDAGFGWYLWDVAVSFQSLSLLYADPAANAEQAGRDAFVRGYRTIHPLSDAEIELAEAMCVARDLNIIGWMDARPEVVPAVEAEAFAQSALARTRRWMDR